MSRFDPKPPFFARLAQMDHDATVARIVGEPMHHVCSPPSSRPQGAEPPDPTGCVWRGTVFWGGDMTVAVTKGDHGNLIAWHHDGPTWGLTNGGLAQAVIAAALLSAHSRLAAMTQERDSERLISAGHEARADRAEAALADVSDRIATLQVALAGGRVP